jgi:membrane protease YdiL (CAAX protease family)
MRWADAAIPAGRETIREGGFMKVKNWLVSEAGAVWVGVLLTLIVLIESKLTAWAPYFIVYAVLAIVIPIWLKTYRFGSFGEGFRDHWKIILSVFLLALFFDQAVFNWFYQWILNLAGAGADPFYSLNATLTVMIDAIASKFSITADSARMLYAFFIILWAPVGEELLYRGYLQGVLRKTRSFRFSAILSSVFFGVRHATHLFFLWPNVPWGAMLSWVVGAWVFGLLMSYLYEKTKSLYPPMLVHAAVNLVELLFM